MAGFVIIFILKFWSVAWFASVALMVFRTDSVAMFSEVFGMLVQNNLFSVLVSAILIFVILPLTIPYSVANILNGDNSNGSK